MSPAVIPFKRTGKWFKQTGPAPDAQWPVSTNWQGFDASGAAQAAEAIMAAKEIAVKGICCAVARRRGRLVDCSCMEDRGPCHRELSASIRGNRLCRSCCLDGRGELGCLFLGLAVTGPHRYFG
jgi:hypothetical protein